MTTLYPSLKFTKNLCDKDRQTDGGLRLSAEELELVSENLCTENNSCCSPTKRKVNSPPVE